MSSTGSTSEELRSTPVEEFTVDDVVFMRGLASPNAVPDRDMGGVLEIGDGCGYVSNDEGLSVVVWPRGTTVTEAGLVRLPDGEEVNIDAGFAAAGQYVDSPRITELLGSKPSCRAEQYALTADVRSQ